MHSILIIDDRADVRASLRFLLEQHQYQVSEADNPFAAQSTMKQQLPELILLDMNYSLDTVSGQEGIGFLEWLQQQEHSIPVIPMTAWSNTALVVKAMQLGARDFIEKPWNNAQLINLIERQLELSALNQQNNKLTQQLEASHQSGYQWQSPVMQTLLTQLATVAQTNANILLTGPNGCGKSELAVFIHQQSGKPLSSLVQVNMGAIVESLFESEMFGHVKGAFTDAKQQRIGRFELAENGSLFLDEIANMTLSQQAKLLRVLESGQYESVGSNQTKRSNARIISATNCDLARAISEGQFRQDLFYRLNTMTFAIPPLSERTEDIVPLAQYFIKTHGQKYQRADLQLTEAAIQSLQNYNWPGNIREMSHSIERAVLLNTSGMIDATDLALVPDQSSNAINVMPLDQAEQMLIRNALKQTGNNVAEAAELLDLSTSALYRRMEKYALGKS
ncbi:sigma-54-dependent transcriptional regulator [Neptunicella marina]|nr:sigma-54 dependent transcriptional regulator [Neptunicella marina]